MSDYNKLKALAEKATPYGWESDCQFVFQGDNVMIAVCSAETGYQMQNSEYIAGASPYVVMGMIDENTRLKEELATAIEDLKLAVSVADGLRKDAERLDWLDKRSKPVVEWVSSQEPEGELLGYEWGVFGQCSNVREAIDYELDK